MNSNSPTTKMRSTTLKNLIDEIDATGLDALWAILKYKEIGILRKVKCMAYVLNVSPDELINQLPQDEGRLLDKPARTEIHEHLIARSKN